LSILTKICVVLVLFVSVMASGAFLRLISVERSWKQSYINQLERADVANLAAAESKIAMRKVLAELAKAQDVGRDSQAALASAADAHAAALAKEAEATAQAKGDIIAIKASLTELSKNLETAQEMQKLLASEKTALAKSLVTANTAARELKKESDDASVQIRRLENMLKHYALLIKDLRAEIIVLQQTKTATVADADAADATPAPPAQAITGRITAVDSGVASINIGRARGIKDKMVLKVFRNGEFVSHLRIDLVRPDSAAGIILDKKLDVMQGDEVATSLK
jgi:hypothetical protein